MQFTLSFPTITRLVKVKQIASAPTAHDCRLLHEIQ